ncbi:MAG: substrate-binding domain-containing protein [Gemmataceae bacterium]
MSKRQRRVAAMIDLDWPLKHHLEVFVGVQAYARQRDWELIVDPFADQALGRKGRPCPYEGIIARATTELAKRARAANVPVVNVWYSSPMWRLPSVYPDFAEAGRLAADHLLQRGLRRFGFLGYRVNRESTVEGNAFRRTVTEAGFPCTFLNIKRGYQKNAQEWRRFQNELDRWIGTWTPKIGVLTSFDLLCRFLAHACGRHGLKVPDDVALIGSRNEPAICLHPTPSLSSVDMNYHEIGWRAGQLLEKLMRGGPAPKQALLVPPRALLARQSTDVVAVSDPLVEAALRYIVDHNHEPIDVSDVVEQLATTRRTLERHFQHNLGRSIAREIARLRLERLKRDLIETDTPVKALAASAGYRNPKQMHYAFARAVGEAPGSYRRRYRHKNASE